MLEQRRYTANQAQDEPIDWSSFTEEDVREQNSVPACKFMRIYGILLLVGSILLLILSITALGGAFVGMTIALLTLVPAAFALQVTDRPTATMEPLVLGIIGVFFPLVLDTALSVTAFALGFDYSISKSVYLIAVFAAIYLLLALYIRRQQKTLVKTGTESSRDRLWDENAIWGEGK